MQQTSILDLRVDDLAEVRMAGRDGKVACWQLGVVVACGRTRDEGGYVKIMVVGSSDADDVGKEFVYVREDQLEGVISVRARVGKRQRQTG